MRTSKGLQRGRFTRRLSRGTDERGAYAVLFSMVLVLVVALAAIAVDIASNVAAKQDLKDTMDAAAHAAAFELDKNPANAANKAREVALTNDPEADPQATFWCVVGSTGVDRKVNEGHIPATCNPGPPEYNTTNYPGLVCDEVICFIPCTIGPDTRCNTIELTDGKKVPYSFAPAIGFDEGSTGAVVSVACTGPCGSEKPNPMDVVFMADRTRSMQPDDRAMMKDAILETLKTMTPQMHHVAFGALHKTAESLRSWECQTTASTGRSASAGKWVPIPYSKDYLSSAEEPTLNTASALVKAISCLPESPSHGTHLAAAFKGGARHLMTAPSTTTGRGTPQKVLIFETDGMPDETTGGPYQGLTNDKDFGAGSNGTCKSQGRESQYYPSNYHNVSLRNWCKEYQYNTSSGNGEKGCQNLVDVAREAKNKGILVITVGFGAAATEGCTVTNKHDMNNPAIGWRTGGTPVRNALAKAASPHPTTGVSSDAGDCATQPGRTKENTDGDFFFCAAGGEELAEIFKTAIAQVGGGIRLLRKPT